LGAISKPADPHPLPLLDTGRGRRRSWGPNRWRPRRSRARPRWKKEEKVGGNMWRCSPRMEKDGRRPAAEDSDGRRRCSSRSPGMRSSSLDAARPCKAPGGVGFVPRRLDATNRSSGRCGLQTPTAALHSARRQGGAGVRGGG
jgi:hypothetical protein